MNACNNTRRRVCSKTNGFFESLCFLTLILCRERQRLLDRYEGWQKMREVALKNAGDGAPVEVKAEYPPPPPVEEEDLGDVSIDLSAAMEAEVAQALDESGIERVPMADPGIGGVPMADEPGSPGGAQGAHVRRRSVLPGAYASESVRTKL